MRVAAAAMLWLAAPALALAQSTQHPARPLPQLPSSGGAIAQVTLSLGLVVALIVVLAWAARRLKLVQRPAGGQLQIVAELPLGQRERLLLVRVGDRQALVGVSPSGVASLQVLESPVRLETPAATPSAVSPAGGFADRLRELLDQAGRKP